MLKIKIRKNWNVSSRPVNPATTNERKIFATTITTTTTTTTTTATTVTTRKTTATATAAAAVNFLLPNGGRGDSGARYRGGSKGRQGGAPSVKIRPPPTLALNEVYDKAYTLPLVRGGSLWQYRSVSPQLQLWPPHCPPNVNPRTATVPLGKTLFGFSRILFAFNIVLRAFTYS